MSVSAFIIDVGFKGLIVLGLAWVASLALSRRSAATRHFAWLHAMGALLLLPLGALLLPSVALPVLPAGDATVAARPSMEGVAAANPLSDSAFIEASEPPLAGSTAIMVGQAHQILPALTTRMEEIKRGILARLKEVWD